MADTHATPVRERYLAPGGYRLGDFVPLHDFLAFPETEEDWDRDEHGRLVFMLPESFDQHRTPLSLLVTLLARSLEPSQYTVMPEPGVGLSRIYDLQGSLLPESSLGPRSVEPDIAVFAGRPSATPGHRHVALPTGLRLVVEVLSPRTWRSDLQRGQADAVDRWRSYLESGVPEYWILNAGVEASGCPLPRRSGLFLQAAGGSWQTLKGDRLRPLSDAFQGIQPIAGGVIHSAAIPGLTLDLDRFWRDLDLPG